jgi:hypothetical protein
MRRIAVPLALLTMLAAGSSPAVSGDIVVTTPLGVTFQAPKPTNSAGPPPSSSPAPAATVKSAAPGTAVPSNSASGGGGGGVRAAPAEPQITLEQARAMILGAHGNRALSEHDYQTAADAFRKALYLTPGDPTLFVLLNRAEWEMARIRERETAKLHAWANPPRAPISGATGVKQGTGAVGDHDLPTGCSGGLGQKETCLSEADRREQFQPAARGPALGGALEQLRGAADSSVHAAAAHNPIAAKGLAGCQFSDLNCGDPASAAVVSVQAPPAAAAPRKEDPALTDALAKDPRYQKYAQQEAAATMVASAKTEEYDRLKAARDAAPDKSARDRIQIEMASADNARQTAVSAVGAARVNQDDLRRHFVLVKTPNPATDPPTPGTAEPVAAAAKVPPGVTGDAKLADDPTKQQ